MSMAISQIEADAPRIGADRLRTSVRGLFAGVFLVLTGLLAVALWWEHSEALLASRSRAENLALILSDHLNRTVSAIDTTLLQLTLHSMRVGGAAAPREAWDGVLTSALSGLTGVGSISVTDASGIIIHSTIPTLVGQSRAEQFIVRHLVASGASTLAVDTPFQGRLSDQWLIPLGRRLPTADGSFAGVVVATLEPGRLAAFYRTVDVGRDGVIWLMHPAGYVLVRQPALPTSPGEPARDNPLLKSQPGASGFVRAPLEPGGASYLNAYQSLRNPPLLLAVSLSEREALSAWRMQAAVAAAVIAGFLILLIAAERAIAREIEARTAADRRVRAQSGQLAAAMSLRAEADAALRASQAQFESIMHHAPMMVSLKDLQGRYTFVNEAFQKFTGRGGDVVLGQTAKDLNDKEFAELITAADREAIESRRVVQREITTPHGARTALMVKFPVFDERGEPTGVGTVMTDITEQKKIEAQLAQTQRIDALGQLTGGIAHDFNNLLMVVTSGFDLILRRPDDRARIIKLAEAGLQASERGARLTRQLLSFARRQDLRPELVNPNALLLGSESLLRRALGETVRFDFALDPGLHPTRIDTTEFASAVLNLVVNARDAVQQLGGCVTVTTSNAVLDARTAGRNPEAKPGNYVVVSVADDGVGMDAAALARAFEPFFTTKDVGKGSGLGLSQVYGFTRAAGGFVEMRSTPGVGTTVEMFLPSAVAPSLAAPEVTPAKGGPSLPMRRATNGETVLAVEDEPAVLATVIENLADLGYSVIAANNAVEALERLRGPERIDILFSDVVMPGGMNGVQLAVEAARIRPGLKVLLTSGYTGQALAGENAVPTDLPLLPKPYRSEELASRLRLVMAA